MNISSDIKLGYECNDACVHCVVEKLRKIANQGKKRRSTQEYKKEVLISKRNGAKSIVVTGGEPTIRPDFIDILKFIYDNGLKIGLQSNGRKFQDFKLAEESSKYVTTYVIALHGHNDETHDKITQRKGSFAETLRGLENLVKIGCRVYGKIVLSNYNYMYLLETLKLYEKKGIKEVLVYYPHSSGEAHFIKKIAPKLTDIKKYIEESLDYFNDANKFYVILGDIFPCDLDKEYPIMHFKEFLKFNSKKRMKPLLDEPRDWGTLRKAIRRKPRVCRECILYNLCDGHWKEYIDERGYSELKPIKKINKNIFFKNIKE